MPPSSPPVMRKSERNMGEKKRKVSFSTSVVMTKKRTTGNAHSFKAKFKVKRKDEIAPVELALDQTKKLTSYQESEQVHSDNSKEGCSLNTIHSGRDHLVAEKNTKQETSNVDEQVLPSSLSKLQNLKRKIVEDSANEEFNQKQSASPFEVAASVLIDTVTVVLPNIEVHDQGSPNTSPGEVAHDQNQDASVLGDQATSQVEVENSEPADVVNPVQSLAESPSHNLERSSSQTAEVADCVVVSHESVSQIGANLQLQSNHPDIGSDSQVNLERNSYPTVEITDSVLLPNEATSQLLGSCELLNNHFGMGSGSQATHRTSVAVSTSSQNNVDVSQIGVNTVQFPREAGLQLGSAGNPYGSSNPLSRRQVTSLSSPPMHAAPLQHELGKISTEIQKLQTSHVEMKSQLKSDREMEIREFLAQMKSNYILKLQGAEAEFNNKKNVLEKNWSKVLLNKLLAESFSSSCVDPCWPRGI